MSRAGYSLKLFREFVQFAKESRNYWLIPLIVVLGLAAVLIVVGQSAAPLIYTIF
ncbi:MAG: DUF5989 family protein [Myxococcota bacterium]